jgi:hypothetical protein
MIYTTFQNIGQEKHIGVFTDTEAGEVYIGYFDKGFEVKRDKLRIETAILLSKCLSMDIDNAMNRESINLGLELLQSWKSILKENLPNE